MAGSASKCLALASSLAVLLHCSTVPDPPAPEHDSVTTSLGAAGASPVRASELVPVPPAGAPEIREEPPAEPHSVNDASFAAFDAKLRATCARDGASSPPEEIANARARGQCLRDAVEHRAAGLPADVRRALAAGPTSDAERPAFSAAWERFVDGVCALDDAAVWIGDGSRQAGTPRIGERTSCRDAPLVEAAYLLDRIGAGRAGAGDFARRVRATEAQGRARLDALPRVRDSLVRFEHGAHEDSLFDDECFYCKLSDADWRRLRLDLDAVAEQSTALARTLCAAWIELADDLGGVQRCNDAVRAHLAWYLVHVPEPFASESARGYAGYPPAKDPDYRVYVDPLIDTCRAGESLRDGDDAFEANALRCIRGVVPERADQAEVRRAIDVYVAKLCGVEQRIVTADIGPLTDVHQRLMDDRVASLECPMLAAERRAYSLFRWASHDARRFAAHVHARLAWAQRIRLGSARARRIAASKTCAESAEVFGGTCRSAVFSAPEWAALRRDLAALPEQAALPAELLCRAWPELAAELGSERCSAQLADYFLAYGEFLGLAALGPSD